MDTRFKLLLAPLFLDDFGSVDRRSKIDFCSHNYLPGSFSDAGLVRVIEDFQR